MECKSCGSINGEMKSGVSKKNGKAWKGWKCECGEMTFIHTPKPQQNSAPQPQPEVHNGNGSNKDLMMATSYCKDIYLAVYNHGVLSKWDKEKIDLEYWWALEQVKNGGLHIVGSKCREI